MKSVIAGVFVGGVIGLFISYMVVTPMMDRISLSGAGLAGIGSMLGGYFVGILIVGICIAIASLVFRKFIAD